MRRLSEGLSPPSLGPVRTRPLSAQEKGELYAEERRRADRENSVCKQGTRRDWVFHCPFLRVRP